MLDKCKLLLNIADSTKDSLLQLLIEQATDEAKAYTRNDSVEELESAIVLMVCFKYSLLGTEGISSENYSGVSFNYETSYPEYIINSLKSHRKVTFR